jgi:hypothetical protein
MELAAAVDRHLGPLARLGGEVLMTGIDSLREAPFYVMGLNPGIGSKYAVRDHAANWNVKDFSAYLHQCWQDDCWKVDPFGRQQKLTSCNHEPGLKRHQKAVVRLMSMICAESPTKVIATNAVFIASKSAASFYAEHGKSWNEAWSACWPVHEWLLSIVRPKVILCLGFGEQLSSFRFLATATNCAKLCREPEAGFKWFDAVVDGTSGTITPRVIGVSHPSYGVRVKDAKRLAAVVQERIDRV